MSRELSRLLRWRHAGFRRRRLPFVIERVWDEPIRALTLPFRHPRLWLLGRWHRVFWWAYYAGHGGIVQALTWWRPDYAADVNDYLTSRGEPGLPLDRIRA